MPFFFVFNQQLKTPAFFFMKIILQWTQNLTLLFFFSSPNFDKWFSKARMWTPWSDAALYHLKSPFIYHISSPRCIFFHLTSSAIWRKRDGARKSKLSELPKRYESYESYKGDVTLNKSPHHGMPYIYTTPEGMRALMSPSLCFCLCLTLSLSALQLHVK